MDFTGPKRERLVVPIPTYPARLLSYVAIISLATSSCGEGKNVNGTVLDANNQSAGCSDGLDMHWDEVSEELQKYELIARKDRISRSDSYIFAFPVKYSGTDGEIIDLTKEEFESDSEKYITVQDFRKIEHEAAQKLGVGTYRGMMLMNGAVGFEFGNERCELKIDSLDIVRVRNWNLDK